MHADCLQKDREVLRVAMRERDVMHPRTNLITDRQIAARLVTYFGTRGINGIQSEL